MLAQQGLRGGEGDPGPRPGVAGRGDRPLQVRVPGLAGGGLGHAALDEQPEGLRLGRRLGQGAPQQERRRLRSAAGRGGAGRLGQPLDGPGVGGRLGGQQVLGDPLGRRARRVQQPRRLAVGLRALGRRQLGVEGLAHHRVGECQRPSPPDDPDGRQRVRRRAGRGGAEPGEGPGLGRLGRLEHGERAGERGGVGRQPRQAHEHPAAHRAAAEAVGRRAVGLGRRHLVLGQAGDHLADQERQAAGRAVARGGEGRGRRRPQLALQQLGDGGRGERRGDDGLGRRVRGERVEQRAALAGLARPRRHDQGDRELVEPRHQEAEEPQRRRVRPVRVVHQDAEGAAAGQVGAEPVEAVEDRERRVLVGEGRLRRRRAGQGEQPRGHPGGALQQLGRLGRGAEGGLEQLAHDPERELALQLGAPRPQHAHAGGVGEPGGVGQEGRLADPGRALDRHQGAASAARPREGRVDAREIALPLQQSARQGFAHPRVPRGRGRGAA